MHITSSFRRRGASAATMAAVLAALVAACAADPGSEATEQRLAAAVRSQPVVLLGEVHDNAAQHRLRAQALQALLDGGARPALLMEQFDREHQAALDRALALPGATPDTLIAAGAGDDAARTGWEWALYRPYLALALRYKLPVVAANVSRTDTRRILKDGLAAQGFDPGVPADIEAAQADAIVESHCGMLGAPQAARMVGAQVARDQFMARAIEAHAARGALLLAGNGHVRRDVGVPRWLTDATRRRSVAIGVLEDGDDERAPFDAVVFTKAQARPDPCAGMRAASAPR